MKKGLRILFLCVLCAIIFSGCMRVPDKNSIQKAYAKIEIGQTKMCEVEEMLGQGAFVNVSNSNATYVWHFGEMTLSLIFDNTMVAVLKSKNW